MDPRPCRWRTILLIQTTNFIHSFPYYCISLGIVRDGIPVVGVVYSPDDDVLYYASKDQGAFMVVRGVTSKMSQGCTDLPKNLDSALVFTEYGASKDFNHLKTKIDIITKIMTAPINGRGIRSVGSAAMSLCIIARGRGDIYYEAGVHVWDIIAGLLILKEAGGLVSNWNGDSEDWLRRDIVAVRGKNECLRQQLLSLLIPLEYCRD